MDDKDLLLIKDGTTFRPFVLDSNVARDILSRDVVRLFGKDFLERDAFCEWLAITSQSGGHLVGVCFADFYVPETAAVVQYLKSERTIRNENGVAVLLTEAPNWKVQQWPYFPAYFLRAKDGDCCYLVQNAFATEDKPLNEFKQVSSLEELAQPPDQHG